MNHTDNETLDNSTRLAGSSSNPGREAYLIAASIILYPVLAGLALSSPGLIGVGASALAYMLSIYTTYGIARFAYIGRNHPLWGSIATGLVAGYFITGAALLGQLLTLCGMIFFAGVVVGRMMCAERRLVRSYAAGAAATVLFVLIFFAGKFGPMMSFATFAVETGVEWLSQMMVYLGWGADAVSHDLENLRKMLGFVVRISPATLVTSMVLPYSLGYLLFSHRINMTGHNGFKPTNFERWKMPFAVMPVVIAVIVLRLLSSGTLALIADNVLAFLAFFYVVTGLSLMEYYLKRYLPKFLRVMFYISLFVSQFSGVVFSLITLLAIVLLGFIDSFLDWRKVQQLSLEEK